MVGEKDSDKKGDKGAMTIEEMATFCKRRGFVYPSGEAYGGLAGFYDFGPLGVELKNNLKQAWWKTFVRQREDIVGIDGSIITHPKVWRASGHLENFDDVLVEDAKTKQRYRADHLVEDALKMPTDGMNAQQLWELIQKHNLKSPQGNDLLEPRQFNLMFSTNVGPASGNTSYLRPETAQLIFANFKQVVENARLKLPFGIAQMGKAFRNEISPRDFLFRMREFEQLEIEYFVHPEKQDDCPYVEDVLDHEMLMLTEEMQNDSKEPKKMKMGQALEKKIIKNPWHAYWLAQMHQWFIRLGAKADNFRIRQHVQDELSHYASETWDLEYKFPFGWKELQGLANRNDYDLKQHMEHSKQDMQLYDEESKKKILPHVACEPSQGVERALLVFLFDAYEDDKERGNIVLHLAPELAPVKIGVFPLLNKDKLVLQARKLFKELSEEFACAYDKSGSIGRRYARNDEIGTPYCITVDFDGLEDGTVTIRERDSTRQVRVPVEGLRDTMRQLLDGRLEFSKLGKHS